MVENKDINELYKIIKEEVALEIKSRIDESLSSKLYHFCPLAAAANIMKDGKFHLSSIDRHSTEKDIATVISDREKAIYPYSKVVDFVNELPTSEKEGIIYKVKTGNENYPNNACFRFNKGQWKYIPNSENASKHIGSMRTGKVTQTELPDGRISYANDSGILKGQYYMCFSRTPGAFDGYSGRMAEKRWKGAYVRFSVNGDILNQRYKGGPVNFYTNYERIPDSLKNSPLHVVSNKSSSFVKKPMQTSFANGEKFANEIDRTKAYEHEDRVFSNDQSIPPKKIKTKEGTIINNPQNIFSSGIVERIDIFVLKSILVGNDEESKKVINDIGYILKKGKQYGFLKQIHIYNTEKGLSILPIQTLYDNSSYYMKKKYANIFKDYMEMEKGDFFKNYSQTANDEPKIKKNINDSDAETIADLIGYILFGHVNDNKKYYTEAKRLIKNYGFTPYSEQILNKLKPLDYYFNDIKKESWWSLYFRFIKSEIDQLQGWKIQKIADQLRRMVSDYQQRCNLPRVGSITTLKKKMWNSLKEKQNFNKEGTTNEAIIGNAIRIMCANKKNIINSIKDDIVELCNENGFNFKSLIKKINLEWNTIVQNFFEDLIFSEERYYGNSKGFIKFIKKNPDISDYIAEDGDWKDDLLYQIKILPHEKTNHKRKYA